VRAPLARGVWDARQADRVPPVEAMNKIMDTEGLRGSPGDGGARSRMDELASKMQELEVEWLKRFKVQDVCGVEAVLADLEKRMAKVAEGSPKSVLEDADVVQRAYQLVLDVVVARRMLYKARLQKSTVPLVAMSAQESS